MEKRHNYVRKVAEVAVQLFITNDKPNISGLVLAGSADFKTELSQSDMFDPVSIHWHFSQVARIGLVYLY
jgi:peptide chain release factor subunit 1